MSIVLHGFGLGEIDSGSSLVTYGLARDLDQGETIEQAVASTGIENLFVVDFSAGQRKPTAAEFRRFKRLVAAMQMGVDDVSLQVTAVPEPASAGMLAERRTSSSTPEDRTATLVPV